MKNKDIKKLIKTNIESHIPESAPKIDFPFATTKTSQSIKRRNSFKWSYGLTFVLSILVIALVFSLLFGEDPVVPPTPKQLLTSENEVISFSALSTVSLLTSTSNELISTQTKTLNTTQQPPIIGYITPYLRMVEEILTNDSGMHIVTGDSEYEAYTTFMQFQTKDLLGNTRTYVMHYNLILEEYDVEDEEYEYILEGILLFNNRTFHVIGEKKIENDEESLAFKAMIDDDNYVESFYQIEDDKQVFEFLIVQFGQVVSESKIEIEIEDEITKVQLEFVEGENTGEFEFEYITIGNINIIRIEFETEINGVEMSGEMSVQVIVDAISGKTSYRILFNPDDDDEYEYDVDRNDEEDEDEEDEDE